MYMSEGLTSVSGDNNMQRKVWWISAIGKCEQRWDENKELLRATLQIIESPLLIKIDRVNPVSTTDHVLGSD